MKAQINYRLFWVFPECLQAESWMLETMTQSFSVYMMASSLHIFISDIYCTDNSNNDYQ